LHNTRPERIRLSGIDCPEKGQAYGNNAKHAARPPWLSCTEPGSNVCPMGVGCEMLVRRGSAKHRVSVLETHRIPLEHTERTLLILGHVISIEERVPETLLFGLPSCTLQMRTRLRGQPSAPFNARCDRFGRIGHGAPPLLDRTSAEWAARLPRRPLMWMSQGLYLSRFRNTLVRRIKDARGSQHRVQWQVFYMFQSVVGIRWRVPEMTSGSLRKAGWGICRITHTAQDNLSCSTGLEIEGQALQSYVSPRVAGRAANELSKPPQSWSLEKKSRFKPTARTSTGAPLETYSCPMAPTSITRWSKTAGGGGIGNTLPGIPN
jgi:hypothetical protein